METRVNERPLSLGQQNPWNSKLGRLNTMQFGSSFEPEHPKLTYTHVRDVNDSVLGKVEVYKFSNGMEFYGVKRTDVPLVSFGEVIKTGSINERASENGVSHFLEHLIFKGSKFLKPGEFDKAIEELGGKINAFTSRNETFYYTYDLPKGSLREAIKLRAEFIQNANVPQAEMDKERGTVVTEIGRAWGKPSSVHYYKMQELIAGKTPLRRTVLGPAKIIQSISRESVMDYYYRYYAPQNRAIIMTGDFDTKMVLDAIAEEYNVPFPTRKPRPNRQTLKPLHTERELTFYRNVKVAQLEVAYPGPKGSLANPKELMALDLLANILGAGESSRLHRALVEASPPLASEFSVGVAAEPRLTYFDIDVSTQPEQLPKVREVLNAELKRVADEGVTADELARARKQQRGEVADTTETLFNLTRHMAKRVSQGDLSQHYGGQLALSASVTAADIQHVAKKYLQPQKAFAVTMLPEADKPPRKRTVRPTFSGNIRFSGALRANETSQTLPNGAEVVVHEKPTSLRTAINIRIHGVNRWGAPTAVRTLLGPMMERGTASLPYANLQELLDKNDIRLSVSTNKDSTELAILGDAQDNAVMFQIARALMQEPPAFKQEDLDKQRVKLRDQLRKQVDDQPLYHSLIGVGKALFPNGPVYGQSNYEAITDFDSVTPDALRDYYGKAVQPQNLTISVSGPVKSADVVPEVEGWLSVLTNTGPKASSIAFPQAPVLEQDVISTKAVKTVKEMSLTEIYRAWAIPGLKDPKERAVALVLNSVWRGGMSARLFQTFREGPHGGLCYSVSSSPAHYENAGMFTFYIGTEHKNVPLVLQLCQGEVDKLVKEPVSAAELRRAKFLLQSSYMSAEQKIGTIGSTLSSHRQFGTDSLDEQLARFEAVTPDDIQAFACKYLTKPSVTAVTAPEEALKANKLPVNTTTPSAFNLTDYLAATQA